MSLAQTICTNLIKGTLKRLIENVPIANRKFHGMASLLQPRPASYFASIPTTAQSTNPQIPVLGKMQRLLMPVTTLLNHVAGFKVKGRVKRRCKDCYFVMRQQRLYNICPTHPRHKQMSMKKREDKTWILTHATQSKIRPY